MKLDGLEIQNDLLEKLLNNRINRKPTMLVGHAGTGKTALARRLSFGGVFRAPHYTISRVGLVGEKRPGEYELAHSGILFLDEFPEFRRDVLGALAAVVKNKEPKVDGYSHYEKVPVDTWIVGAMNSCACGRPKCLCEDSGNVNERYLKRTLDNARYFGFEFIYIESYYDQDTKLLTITQYDPDKNI